MCLERTMTTPSNDQSGFSVLQVGSVGKPTGGISQYIDQISGQESDLIRIDCFDVGVGDRTGLIWFLVYFLYNVADFVRFQYVLLRSSYDIVHVHSSQDFSFLRASALALTAKYLHRRAVVFHCHGSEFADFVRDPPPGFGVLQRAVIRRMGHVFTVSRDMADAVERRADIGTASVVRHGVNPSAYDPQYESDLPRLLLISNLLPRKGIEEFLSALDRLPEHHDFTVDIAGTGPLGDDVEQFADARPHVDYHGYVSDKEKHDLLSRATIYVLPTHSEAGVPIAVVEGMGGGNAVVTCDVSGIAEVLDKENGVLIEPGDVSALVAALEELLSDPEVVAIMGRTNREMVEEIYSVDAMASQVFEVYQNLLRVTDLQTDTQL